MAGPKSTRAFTLIELLVVIGIIGVLITLLMPTVSRAMVMARQYMTRSTIKELEVGIEAFKADFKVYPPSQPYVLADPASGQQLTGAANLAYYLLGPGRSGWGIAGGGLMPFTNARPSRSYGPYYQADEDAMAYSDLPGEQGQVEGFLDVFDPPGVILYFAGRNDASGNMTFYWSDGNRNGVRDPMAKKNYATLAYFEQCVKGEDATATTPYRRQDYFLVSPGQDGRYGAIMQNENTGDWEPTNLDAAGAYCDDIGNWRRSDER
jgi:prepilin-type N-terminal cleavage/methylation domain-containing protein